VLWRTDNILKKWEISVQNPASNASPREHRVNQYLQAILAISSLAFSEGLIAENMTEHEYKTASKNITTEYDIYPESWHLCPSLCDTRL
jgi:hypothetical protein